MRVLLASDGVIHGHNLPPTLQMPETARYRPGRLAAARVDAAGKGHDRRRAEDRASATCRGRGGTWALRARMVRYKIKKLHIDYQRFFHQRPGPGEPAN